MWSILIITQIQMPSVDRSYDAAYVTLGTCHKIIGSTVASVVQIKALLLYHIGHHMLLTRTVCSLALVLVLTLSDLIGYMKK